MTAWPSATRFGVSGVLRDLAARASERDSTREAPFTEIRLLQAAGIPSLRIPEDFGGSGIALPELYAFVGER